MVIYIIIPFRDELSNLPLIFGDILKQSYQTSNTEVLLIDDHSEDEGEIRLCQACFRIYSRKFDTARHIEPIGHGGWEVHLDERFVDV